MTSPDKRIRVAVVYGGRSSEHGISAVSAGSVLAALDPQRYEVVPIGITTSGQWLLTGADETSLRIVGRQLPQVSTGAEVALRGVVSGPDGPAGAEVLALDPDAAVRVLSGVDVVFPVLHGRYGEDGTIQGLLELAGIPYVGAGVLASAAAMDKEFTKKLLAADGLPVGEYRVFRAGQPVTLEAVAGLGLPVFVKPARAGSSLGVSKVGDWSQLADAVATARQHDGKVLVEAAVVGREVECGVLEDADGRPRASVPAEIRIVDPGGSGWYDFDTKYLDDRTEFDVPPDLPDAVVARLQDLACQAFLALDGAGLARVDFFLTPDLQPVINEVNTMPGFTPISMFPRMWAATGLPYPELVDRLVAAALRRAAR
jgi:D-alanine-D-alanine ligase